jgi:hypothetical protein
MRAPVWLGALALLVAVAFAAAPAVPRAAFVPDDYRYLSLLREIDAGVPGALARSTIVENRWDQDWWIPDGTYVRFFRPLVVASYALDRALCGESARGFVIGNVVLHALVTLLVWGCLRALLGAGAAAWLGALVFAVQSCHAEQLCYVAGRTDTLAALLVFAALFVFLRGGGARTVAPIYLLAMLVKEYAVLLPLFFLLADRCFPGRERGQRSRAVLYAACAFAALAFLAARHLALGEAGSGGRPFPYFHLPERPGFAAHVAACGLQYAVSLVAGLPCAVFLADVGELRANLETLFERAPGLGWLAGSAGAWLAVGAAGTVALLAFGLRERRGRFFVAWFVVLLVPMLPLYSTGRYLYLPGFGWCGLLALAGAALARRALPLAVVFWVLALLPQAAQCRMILGFAPLRPPAVTLAETIAQRLRDSGLDLASGAPIWVVDLPVTWIEIQFLAPILNVELAGAPPVRLLCKGPIEPGSGLAEVTRVDPHTVELGRAPAALHQTTAVDFDQRPVREGECIRASDCEVTVLAADAQQRAQRVRVRFARPLAELQLARCVPADGGDWRIVPIR